MSFLGYGSPDHVMWAPVLAFSCILVMLAILLSLPYLLTRMRRVPVLNSFLDKLAILLGAPMQPPAPSASKKPLPKCMLRSLRITHYKPRQDCEDPDPECCPICFNDYSEGQAIIELHCKHFFHKECITRWLKRDTTCPMCKADLVASNSSNASSSSSSSGISGSTVSSGAGTSAAVGAPVVQGMPAAAATAPAVSVVATPESAAAEARYVVTGPAGQ